VRIAVDIYRPESENPFPVLLSFGIYNKDLQGPRLADSLPPQPAWSPVWTGLLETGDTKFFVSRGYVHVIGSPRSFGKSESGGSREWDCYDLIEWLAGQPWCDGNVGMVGISGYGAEQLAVAQQQPPHLRAIFPFDPRGAYGKLGGFRHEYPGGVLHLFRYLINHFSVADNGGDPELTEQQESDWREAMRNPDYRMYPHVLNVLSMKGRISPNYFQILIDPYERTETVEESESSFEKISVPAYLGSGWYAYTYKTHLEGAQSWYEKIRSPKRLLLTGPAHLDRPFSAMHSEILKWHDHWLKGLETGVEQDPPVTYWVMGENRWRTASDWPLPETQWTRFYLGSWERLSPEPFTPSSVADDIPPDAFLQMPPTRTTAIQKLRYCTEPLPTDLLVAGPAVLSLFAAIDQEDTNWIVIIKDLGPDGAVKTALDRKRGDPLEIGEREITRGWLKASHRAIDEVRSKPWKPWHPLTREAQRPVVPGQIEHYEIEIMATANLFRAGHRICVEICSMDLPTGVGGATNVEYCPYHICSSRTTVHTIYHDTAHPSHLLLPIIPQ
jgi:predicted acyl esterase